MAGRGPTGHGLVELGLARILNQHVAWLGAVRHGKARHGRARQGFQNSQHVARWGGARRGKPGLGSARQGRDLESTYGAARPGQVRPGEAGRGTARPGKARQGFYGWAHISQKGKSSDCISAGRATGARIFPRATRAVYCAGGWHENPEKRTAVRDNQ